MDRLEIGIINTNNISIPGRVGFVSNGANMYICLTLKGYFLKLFALLSRPLRRGITVHLSRNNV